MDLRKKYQPQWHFKDKKSALKELTFQKEVNPRSYRWLKKKDIKIAGKRISVKSVLGKRRIK